MTHEDRGKPDTAKSAIADYYGDLLGSIADDPLKKLEDAERAASKQLTQEMGSKTSFSSPSYSPTKPDRSRNACKSSSLRPQKAGIQAALFQSDRKRDVLAPIVIPATFPKVAPPPSSPESNVSPSSKTKKVVRSPNLAVDPTPAVITQKGEDARQQTIRKEVEESREVLPDIPQRRVEVKETSTSKAPAESFKPLPWLENGRPVWGQQRFECLLFSVAGLKLAVPLISLGAIYRIEKELTPLVGRADWFMGLYRSGDRNVQVVDTAQWVMPDRCSDLVREGYQFIIRLGDNNWGIACDKVEQAVQLEPSQVKWRTVRSKRPWLSGTVIDHMCALLDADTLSYMLQRQAKSLA